MAWGHAAATAMTHDTAGNAGSVMKGFVPEIWSGRILKALDDKLVVGKLVNRDYEGQIKAKGDTVRVHMVGNVISKPYAIALTRNETPVARLAQITYQTLDGASTTVAISEADYFAFEVEDIEETMSNPKYVAEASARAGVALAQSTERFILGSMITAAKNGTADDFGQLGGTNAFTNDIFGGASLDIGAETSGWSTAYNGLVDLAVHMDDNLAPEDGRWLIAPSFILSSLLKDDRFVGAGAEGAGTLRANGKIGTIAGFTVYTLARRTFQDYDTGNQNTQVPNDLTTNATASQNTAEMWTGASGDDLYDGVAGVNAAYTFADAINKVETVRLEGAFANGVRGLHVYGGKAMRPQWLNVVRFQDKYGASGSTINPES